MIKSNIIHIIISIAVTAFLNTDIIRHYINTFNTATLFPPVFILLNGNSRTDKMFDQLLVNATIMLDTIFIKVYVFSTWRDREIVSSCSIGNLLRNGKHLCNV